MCTTDLQGTPVARPSPDTTSRLRRLLEARLGMAVPDDRLRQSIAPYVAARSAALGTSVDALVERLAHSDEQDPELERLVSVCVVQETRFFRDAGQLRALGAAAVERQRALGRPLQIWSAGCATGEEPYSLAILMDRLGVPVEILGTDVDPAALALAESGAGYSARAVRDVPVGTPHLQAQGATFGVSDTIRRRVRWQRHNLHTAPPPVGRGAGDPRWDLIVCRNVLIYLAPRAIEAVAARFAAALVDGGQLWVGASETLIIGHPTLRPVTFAGRTALSRGPLAPPPRPVPRPEPAPAALDEIERLIDEGHYVSAIALLQSHVEQQPGDALSAVTLGNLLQHQHAFDPALEAYARALRADPALAEAHFLAGVVHAKRRDPSAACQALSRALEDSEACWPAAYLLATTLDRSGRTLPAELAYQRCLRGLEQAGGQAPLRSRAEMVNSVHRDPQAVAAAARDRLAALASPASGEVAP